MSGGTGASLPAARPRTPCSPGRAVVKPHRGHAHITLSSSTRSRSVDRRRCVDADVRHPPRGSPIGRPAAVPSLRRWQRDGETIVVIEDDHNISDLVALYLRREGFRVLQADDGEQGLAYVERDRPKLVVVDVGLPGELDGFDVCRRLRADGDVPVVMLTARDDEIDRVVGLRARRRRLRHQALLAARARGPRAGHPAPGRDAGTAGRAPRRARGGRRRRRHRAARGRAWASTVVALTSREFDLLTYLAHNTRAGAVTTPAPRRRVGRGLVRRRAHRRRPCAATAQEARRRASPSPRCGGSATGSADGRPVRRRITVAILAVVIGTLVLTVAGSLLLVHRAAITTAENEITAEGQALGTLMSTHAVSPRQDRRARPASHRRLRHLAPAGVGERDRLPPWCRPP